MGNSLSVLIVDDKVDVRDTVKDTLEDLEVSFIEASNGEEALKLIRSKKIDLIILDIRLPGIDGIETFKKAKAFNPDLPPVIVLTGYDDIEPAVKAGKLGVFDYILKDPLPYDQLKDSVIKATSWGSKTNDNIVKRCFKLGISGCKYEIPIQEDLIFVGTPIILLDKYEYGIRPTVESLDMKCYFAYEDKKSIDISCKICGSLQQSRLAIMDISGLNPNVLFEIGLAYGYGKVVILLKDKNTNVPTDLQGIEYVEYYNIDTLKNRLEKYLNIILS